MWAASLTTRTSRRMFLQPPPPVQRELQLSTAVGKRTAIRERFHWVGEPVGRRLAVEWDLHRSERVPLHAPGWLESFREGRLKPIGRGQLVSQFKRTSD